MSNSENQNARLSAQNLTFWQLLFSVLAAAFGVQTEKNRIRDFERAEPVHFIIIGISLTVFFVVLMIGLVRFVLEIVS